MNTQDKELRDSWDYFRNVVNYENQMLEAEEMLHLTDKQVGILKEAFRQCVQVFFQKTPETPQVGQLWYVCVPGTDQVILRRLLAFSHERDKWLIGGIGNKLCEAIAPSWLFVRYRRFPRLRRLFNRLLGKS